MNIILLMCILMPFGIKSLGKLNTTVFISGVKLYPKLNFTLPMNQSCWLWDDSMEEKYLSRLHEWETKPLQVFLVPFSHNDAGWLLTFEEYYEHHTQKILNNLARTFPILKGFRFSWTEICFLERWWTRATDLERESIKSSIHSGHLEIVGGGWVMPDEATTSLYGLLDQLIEGHQWLYENLGTKVHSSWSLDPFGVSSSWAYLLANSGINFTLIQRVHWAWKRYLSKECITDFQWTWGSGSGIQTRVQPTASYSITGSCGPVGAICTGFDFNPDISEATPIKFENVRSSVELLLGQYGRLGSVNAQNAVFVTLGTDFRFENKSEWLAQYHNYKAIIDYVNSNEDLYHARLAFATPGDYAKQVGRPNARFEGDFFVYSDLGPPDAVQDDYWSGFYSSRPYWKLLGRKVESMVRSAEIMFSVVNRRNTAPSIREDLDNAFALLVTCRRNLGIFQHHDAITGTSKRRVMADFERKLWRAAGAAVSILKTCSSFMASGGRDTTTLERLSPGRILRTFPSSVLVFNPLMQPRAEIIRISLSRSDVSVRDMQTGQPLPYQQIDEKSGTNDFELLFIVELKELELAVYEVDVAKDGVKKISEVYVLEKPKTAGGSLLALNASGRTALFSPDTGFLAGLSNDYDHLPLKLGLHAYKSVPTRSGAYLFKPQHSLLTVNRTLHTKNITVSQGPLYKQVTAQYGPAFSVRTRIYEHPALARLVEIVISVDFGEPWAFVDSEVFVRLTASGLNNTQFVTDTNGLGRQERPRIPDIGVGGNFYPVTEEAYLDDGSRRLSVLCDRAHGVASLESGQMDFMIDRRILLDDLRGLEEGLVDQRASRSRLWVIVGSSEAVDTSAGELSLWLNHCCSVFLARKGFSPRGDRLVTKSLPPGNHLVTLRTLSNSQGMPGRSTLAVVARMRQGNSSSAMPAFFPKTRFSCERPTSMVRTSLTGVNEYEQIDSLAEVTLTPASVTAVKLYFR